MIQEYPQVDGLWWGTCQYLCHMCRGWERCRYIVYQGQESDLEVAVVWGIDPSQGCFEEGSLKGQDR